MAKGLVRRVSTREYHKDSCSQKGENSFGDRVAEMVPLYGV